MASTPQLPFEIISKILQERKNIKKLERELEESKEKYNEVMRDFMFAVTHFKMDEIITSHENLTMKEATEIFNQEDNSEFIMNYIINEGYNHLNNYLMG